MLQVPQAVGGTEAPSVRQELLVRDTADSRNRGGNFTLTEGRVCKVGRGLQSTEGWMSGQPQPVSPKVLPHQTPSCLFPSLESFLSPSLLPGAWPELLLPVSQPPH